MPRHVSFSLLFLLTGCNVCILQGTVSPIFHDDIARYCRISTNHTMCQFPTESPGEKCRALEDSDLDKRDIKAIVYWHNTYRNIVASGEESRGNPGPQPAAKNMMELIWDEELAHIARRWALQCSLLERDQRRDVERFKVWQNVHVLDTDSVGSITSIARIHIHIQSWYDEVEHFDSAEVGLVNFSVPGHLYYVPFALATITYVGCGRAIYTADGQPVANQTDAITPVTFGSRVEALVCNYGPFDGTTSRELYQTGAPGFCPSAMIRSPRYRALCQKFQEQSPRRNVQRRMQREEEQNDEEMKSGALPAVRAIYLGHLLILLLPSI